MKILAIDINFKSVQFCVLEVKKRKKKILDLVEISFQGHSIQEVLKQFFSTRNQSFDRILVGVGHKNILFQKNEYPFSDKSKIEMALLGEYEDNFPIEIEDYVLEAKKFGKIGRNHQVYSGILLQKYVDELNEFFSEMKLIPSEYLMPGQALAFLCMEDHLTQAQPNKVVFQIHIGHQQSNISILKVPSEKAKSLSDKVYSSSLLEMRNVNRGTKELNYWLDKEKAMTETEIEEWMATTAEIRNDQSSVPQPGDAASDGIKQALRPLLVEVYQTIQAFMSKHDQRIDYILLSGALTNLKGFIPFLTKELRAEVIPWNPLESFVQSEVSLGSREAYKYVSVAAIASRYGATSSFPWLNFRRSQQASSKMLTSSFSRFGVSPLKEASYFLLFLIPLLYLFSFLSSSNLMEKTSQIQGDIKKELYAYKAESELSKSELVKVSEDPGRAQETIEKIRQALKKKNLEGVGMIAPARLDLLSEVSQSLPAKAKLLQFKVFEEGEKGAKIESLLELNSSLSLSELQTKISAKLNQYQYTDIQVKGEGKKFSLTALKKANQG